MRVWSLIARLCLGLVTLRIVASDPLRAQNVGSEPATKEDLDLPVAGSLRRPDPPAGIKDAEDNLCVAGCRLRFTTEALFLLVDRSREMEASGALEAGKRVALRALSDVSSSIQIGVVFFDDRVSTFPRTGPPVPATPGRKRAAAKFVASASGGRDSSCVRKGLLAALDLARRSVPARCSIVYLGDGSGDGGGTNERDYLLETLRAVTTSNVDGVVIHALAIGEVSRTRESFLRGLACANGGEYGRLELTGEAEASGVLARPADGPIR